MAYESFLRNETVQNSRYIHAIGLGAFFLIYASLLQGIHLGQLYTFGDLAPYYGISALEKFTNTWHDDNLGYPYIYNVLPAYLGVITLLGGALAQNLFYLALIPAGFLTFFYFVGRFVDPLPARYLAAGVYAINPITIGEFVNGSIAALIGFVGLPLVIHYLYETVERDDWLAPLSAGIVFGATTASPWLAFWMVAPFGAYLALVARHSPRILAKLVASGIVGVILALPSVHHVLQRAIGLETEEGSAVVASTLDWNYTYAEPLSILRLAGNRGIAAMNQLGYNYEPVLAIGLVIPAVALLAWKREELYVYYAVTVAIVVFMTLTRLEITHPLFETLPPLWSVRNPVKLQYPLLLSMSVLFGAGVAAILRGSMRPPSELRVVGKPRRRPQTIGSDGGPSTFLVTLIIGLLVFSLVIYSLPAVGAFGHEEVRGEDYYVPEHYAEVAEQLDGRTLWLPYGYQTQLYLRHTQPDHVGIRSGGVLHGIPNAEYVEELFADVARGADVHDQLEDLGVQYVVVEADPPDGYDEGQPRQVTRWGAPWIWGNPDVFSARFDESDRYTRVESVQDLTIYRVDGVSERERLQERSGLHALATPEEPEVERLNDENLVSNPRFEDGFQDWWTPRDSPGREITLVERDGDQAASMTVNDSADRLPIAQALDVRDRHQYELSLDTEGEGEVFLFWFNGEPNPDNLIAEESMPVADISEPITAQGDTLSIRIRPNASSTLVVQAVELYRTTYPSAIGLEADGEIPGIVTDWATEPHRDATVVGVNLDDEALRTVDPDVRIIDAETVARGELVFDTRFRQGVAVLLKTDEWPESVPDDARMVTHDTDDGEVVDYWITGEFDERPLTVLHTSYHEDWEGSSDGQQFRADGWANAFTDTTPEEVRWTGGELRPIVLQVWGGSWIVAIGLLVGTTSYRWHRRRPNGRL